MSIPFNLKPNQREDELVYDVAAHLYRHNVKDNKQENISYYQLEMQLLDKKWAEQGEP